MNETALPVRQRTARFLGLLTVGILLAGCAGTAETCIEPQHFAVTLEVAGIHHHVVEAQILGGAAVRIHHGCGPAEQAWLAPISESTLSGTADAGPFEEMRITFTDSVIRLRADLSINQDTAFIVDLEDPKEPSLAKNGVDVHIERWEVLPNADSYASFSLQATMDLEPVDQTYPLTVNTSWNRGAVLLLRADVSSDEDVEPPMDFHYTLSVLNPSANETHRIGIYGNATSDSVLTGPLEKGLWKLRVVGAPSHAPTANGTLVLVAYFDY